MVNPNSTSDLVETSREFMLVEYERLASFQKSASDTYQRRFDIYLAVVSAAIVGLVSIGDISSLGFRNSVLMMILVALLIVGFTIFASLATISTWQVHLERAMRMIQDKYRQIDPGLDDYLYFNVNSAGIAGIGFISLILRGVTTGGPKTILVIGNSLVIAFIFVKTLSFLNFVNIAFSIQSVSISMLTFLFSAIFHVLYARLVYKISGI